MFFFSKQKIARSNISPLEKQKLQRLIEILSKVIENGSKNLDFIKGAYRLKGSVEGLTFDSELALTTVIHNCGLIWNFPDTSNLTYGPYNFVSPYDLIQISLV